MATVCTMFWPGLSEARLFVSGLHNFSLFSLSAEDFARHLTAEDAVSASDYIVVSSVHGCLIAVISLATFLLIC